MMIKLNTKYQCLEQSLTHIQLLNALIKPALFPTPDTEIHSVWGTHSESTGRDTHYKAIHVW